MIARPALSAEGRQEGWTQYEVRRMLRQLRRPDSLELHPLARVLADVLSAASPYDAVRDVVDRAFIDAGTIGKKLRELVYRSDIDGTHTRATVARQMNLSARQYFRYRNEAIRILVTFINALVCKPARGQDQLLARLAQNVRRQDPGRAARIFESLATTQADEPRFVADALESRIDAGETLSESAFSTFPAEMADHLSARLGVVHAQRARDQAAEQIRDRLLRAYVDQERSMPADIAFELARADLVLARHAHATFEFELVASRMRSIAQADPSLAFDAVISEIESDLLGGRNAEAQAQLRIADRLAHSHTVRETALVTLQSAGLMLQSGELANALTYGEAARCALRSFSYERSLADVLTMRARFAMGEPLRHIQAVGFPWRDAYVQALQARECLAMGDLDRARVAAAQAIESAQGLSFDGVVALGLATLASLTYQSDREHGLSQLLKSWKLFLKCGATNLAPDLLRGTIFQNHRLEETLFEDDFFTAYLARVEEEFPSSPLFATPATRTATGALFRECAKGALEARNAGDSTSEHIEKLRREIHSRPSSLENLGRFRTPIVSRAQMLLSPWVGEERVPRFSSEFSRRLNAIFERCF